MPRSVQASQTRRLIAGGHCGQNGHLTQDRGEAYHPGTPALPCGLGRQARAAVQTSRSGRMMVRKSNVFQMEDHATPSEQASRWVARIDAGPLNAVERQELRD